MGQRALYGCLRSALLFYERMLENLKPRRFIINPYDPYVANMIINGKHMTIPWHVNDLKILHVDADKATKLIDWMKRIYGSNIKESCGKKHDYLGTNLELSVDGEVRVTITDDLKKIISNFTQTINGIDTTPVAEHLFAVK